MNRKPDVARRAESPNHEPDAANLRALFGYGLALLVTLAIVMVVAGVFQQSLQKKDSPAAAPSGMVRTWPADPNQSIILLEEESQRESLRNNARAKLEAPPSWLDPEKGIVRIPIDMAMEIVAENSSKVKGEENGPDR